MREEGRHIGIKDTVNVFRNKLDGQLRSDTMGRPGLLCSWIWEGKKCWECVEWDEVRR